MNKQLEAKFITFLSLIGKKGGHKESEWNLDFLGYGQGGYVIVEYMENGGVHHPLGQRRLSKAMMEACLDMAIAMKRSGL